jgi:hypothetical protein
VYLVMLRVLPVGKTLLIPKRTFARSCAATLSAHVSLAFWEAQNAESSSSVWLCENDVSLLGEWEKQL